ncbi:MAG: AlpA family phage regulatory protein [Rhodospirillaceae bacterium]
MANHPEPDRILSAKKRRELVPYSDMHIWRLEKAGQFPRRIRLGANRVGWSEREVLDWIEQRKAARAHAGEAH